MGTVEDFRNFVNAVIDERSFDKIKGYIDRAAKDPKAKIIAGGKADKAKGYFIDPTDHRNHRSGLCHHERRDFRPGAHVSMFIRKMNLKQTMDLVNRTSPYALTGSIISRNRQAIELATERLRQAAGNFYINDKPTGAVVGQQPFGGARGSGTNDKAGSILNLYRWLSARTIKETFQPPTDHEYPFLAEA